MSFQNFGPVAAPSTMLRMVPLPRFAGEDPGETETNEHDPMPDVGSTA